MSAIDLNPHFRTVLSFINETAQSVFVTGKAGTGKTTLLKYVREHTLKQVAVVAPTGVAAINAGGTTIHSFFQLPFGPFLPAVTAGGDIDPFRCQLQVRKYNAQRLAIMRSLEVLIIDEVSMVRGDVIDQVDATLRYVRKSSRPFGGVQLLLIGDMFQLAPVVQRDEWKLLSGIYPSPFFFDSLAMRSQPPVHVELQRVYRQSDTKFIDLLNQVRHGRMDAATVDALNSRFNPHLTAEDFLSCVTLTTHNRKADEINARGMSGLPGKATVYNAEITGQFPQSAFPVDEQLELKLNARVMFTRNNAEKNYYNGKTGVVTSLGEDTVHVRCDEDGSEIEVERESWPNVAYSLSSSGQVQEEVLGAFSQLPLRHAWAITIHKSQGLTFSNVIIDAAEAFSAGQVYVALSRCRTFEGLVLSSRLAPSALKSDASVLDFSARSIGEGEMQSRLALERAAYFRRVLTEAFELAWLGSGIAALRSSLQKYDAKITVAGDWMDEVEQRGRWLCEVSAKFLFQLERFMDAAGSLEADMPLRERVRQAADYFVPALRDIFASATAPRVTTSNREVAQRIGDDLRDIAERTSVVIAMLSSLKQEISLSGLLAARRPVPLQEKIDIYAMKSRAAKEEGGGSLVRQLALVRDRIVRDHDLPAYMVASGKTLQLLAAALPQTKEDLLQVKGFGKARVDAFGEEFLSVIRGHCEQNNLSTDLSLLEKKKVKSNAAPRAPWEKPAKADRPSTREQSFNMFSAGFSVEEIARERKCTVGTVQGHLLPYVASGEIALDKLVDPSTQSIIRHALEDGADGKSLSVLKSRLPENISYGDIRFVIAAEAVGSPR